MEKSILGIIFISVFVHASDPCRNVFDPLQKVACATSPAVLESLNPGLKIPTCESGDSKPKVVPSHLPVSAVFVTCTRATRNSCKEIAASILKNGKGATVNVLYPTSEQQEVQISLQEIAEIAKQTGAPINFIPIQQPIEDKVYTRDIGVFRSEASKAELVAPPYAKNFLGSKLAEDVANYCGFGYKIPYKNLSKFDSAYAQVMKLDENKDKSPLEIEKKTTEKVWENDLGAQSGGNFLVLPGGTLITARSPGNRKNDFKMREPDKELLDFFRQSQDVMTIDIPELAVGHIDEVFNIIPSAGPCGYAILRASPKEAKKFLATRPQNEFIGDLGQSYISPEETQDITNINSKMYANGTSIKDQERMTSELIVAIRKTKTIRNTLLDAKLMKQWDDAQDVIEKATKKIVDELTKTRGSCNPEVVDLPVIWNNFKKPAFANPVNGLTVNGHYHFSRASFNQIGSPSRAFPELDNYIAQKLSPYFGENLHGVDTKDFDTGSGNFHCATTNIYLPCK